MNRALPDIELAVVTRLRGVLVGYDVGTTLGTARPAITVSVAGGAPLIETVLDNPRVSIVGWANTRADAWRACSDAVSALVTSASASDPGWATDLVTVHRAFTVMRPVFSLDPVSETPRYDATISLTARTKKEVSP